MKLRIKKVKIEDKTSVQLQAELGVLERDIAQRNITFVNAKGEARDCPYGAFNHTGKIVVTREQDAVLFDQAFTVLSKVDAESRLSGNLSSVKATCSAKMGTCSATVRTTGMLTAQSPVTEQLANVQKLHNAVREIRTELYNRAEIERLEKAKAAVELLTLVDSAHGEGNITDEEKAALNYELTAT